MKTKIIHCISIVTIHSLLSGPAVADIKQVKSPIIINGINQLSTTNNEGSDLIKWEVTTPFRLFKDQKDLNNFVLDKDEPEYTAENPIQQAEEKRANTLRNSRKNYQTPYDKTYYYPGDVDQKSQLYKAESYKEYKKEGRMLHDKDWVAPNTHKVKVSIPKYLDKKCIWKIENSPGIPGSCSGTDISLPSKDNGSTAEALVTVKVVGSDTLITQKIKVRDLLIVGMGDSFASGEGNPDKPATFLDTPDKNGKPNRVSEKNSGGEAFWLDRVCHRSLYSQQSRAAMQLAKYNPHQSVTFLGFGCSGAKIGVGLLDKYKGAEELKRSITPNHWDRSQFDSVIASLCNKEIQSDKKDLECKEGFKRPIDFLLMSIGGNDIGFAPVIKDIVTTHQQKFLNNILSYLPLFGPNPTLSPKAAYIKIDTELETPYSDLVLKVLQRLKIKNGKKVLLTLYPNIINDEKGESCGSNKNHREGLNIVSEDSEITDLESKDVLKEVLNPLNKKIISIVKDNWTIIDEHTKKFEKHGWCASQSQKIYNVQDSLKLPNKQTGVWKPIEPNDYNPYANRSRWVRSPNDAYMTTSYRNNYDDFLKDLAGTNGAFHPTAMGHAVIADAVYKKLTELTDKLYPE